MATLFSLGKPNMVSTRDFAAYYLIYIHMLCRLEALSLVDGGTYHLTVANYRMLIGWQMVCFGHD